MRHFVSNYKLFVSIIQTQRNMLKGGFSLKIQKRETNKVQKVVKRGFEKIEEENDGAEIIKGIDSEKGIIGTKPKTEEKALVIPCIKGNAKTVL